MPRRQKPAGYEKWTWAEIDAGRRFSKSEKRWNRAAKDMCWSQRDNGSYEAPAAAKPLLIVIVILMVGLTVVAPKGLANTKGEAGAAGTLIFLAIIAVVLFMALIGSITAGAGFLTNLIPESAFEPRPDLADQPLRPPVLIPALKRVGRGIAYALSCKWVATLPEWAQPICWGLGIAMPLVGGFFLVRLLFGWSPRP